MVGPGDEDQERRPSNIEDEADAVVENVLADGYHRVACNHQYEGETSAYDLPASSLFKDGNDEGQQCQCTYHDRYTQKEVVGYACFLEK